MDVSGNLGTQRKAAGELCHIYGGGVMDATQLRTYSHVRCTTVSYSPSNTGLGHNAVNHVTRFD